MLDPVILLADGRSYDRLSLEEWIKRGHLSSPLTGAWMSSFAYRPNIALRKAILDIIHHVVGEEKEKKALLEDQDDDSAKRLLLIKTAIEEFESKQIQVCRFIAPIDDEAAAETLISLITKFPACHILRRIDSQSASHVFRRIHSHSTLARAAGYHNGPSIETEKLLLGKHAVIDSR